MTEKNKRERERVRERRMTGVWRKEVREKD